MRMLSNSSNGFCNNDIMLSCHGLKLFIKRITKLKLYYEARLKLDMTSGVEIFDAEK